MDIQEFEKFCATRNVELTPNQRTFAESILKSDAQRQFLMGGMASGRTFVFALLEAFCDLHRRNDASANIEAV